MSIDAILTAIDHEIHRLQSARKLLTDAPVLAPKKGRGRPKKAVTPIVPKQTKRVLSADARARIAAAQKKRWAASKKAK